jgi:hypothetical protein
VGSKCCHWQHAISRNNHSSNAFTAVLLSNAAPQL